MKILITLLFVLITTTSWAKPYWYNCTSVLGGAEGSLDSINGILLNETDRAIVVTASGQTSIYALDEDSALTEDSTTLGVVSPDLNAGDKRWILQWSGGRVLIPDATIDQGDSAITGTLAWHIDNASSNATTVTVLPGTHTISTTTTVPSTMTLKLEHGGILADDASNASLTLNGSVEAGLYQIFNWGTGTGTLSFGVGSAQTVSIKWFGAVGDGSTDDFDAWSEANDALANGGVIEIPARFNSKIDFVTNGKISLNSNIEIIGNGWSSIITCFEGQQHSFELDSGNKFYNFKVVGGWDGSSNWSYSVFRLNDNAVVGAYFESLWIDNAQGYAIYIDNGATDIYIKDCRITGPARRGIVAQDGRNWWFEDNEIDGDDESLSTGVGLEPDSSAEIMRNIHIRGNSIHSFSSAPGLTVGGNSVLADPVRTWKDFAGVFIEGNRIYNNGTHGIDVVNFSNIHIIDNDVHNNGDQGVLIRYAAGAAIDWYIHGVTIRGNRIYENTDHGLEINGDASYKITDVIISVNIIRDNATSGATGKGCHFSNVESNTVIVTDNLLKGNGDSGDGGYGSTTYDLEMASGIRYSDNIYDMDDEGEASTAIRAHIRGGRFTRALLFNKAQTLADEATPSVDGYNFFITGGTANDPITDFDDGVEGQTITIIADHQVIITDGTNIFTKTGGNLTLEVTDTLVLIQKSDGKWYQIGGEDNT